MFSKRVRFLTTVAAAVGIPYAWFNENLAGSLQSGWSTLRQTVSSWHDGSRPTWPVSISTSDGFEVRDPNAPPIEATVQQLREALRFEVTPTWVTRKWPRISTIRAERDLVGLRVPLVTGTESDDFAGSLTYYFDGRHHLRRITLHGQMGDDRALVSLVTEHFGLRPEPTLGAGMYLLRWNAKPMNVLRVSHAPVVRAEVPNAKLIIEMEINDVSAGYGVSPEFSAMLQNDQHVRQWET